jgi:tRNA/tmRNA/rRNA uracil-C5-methylase (TrmA/RlmC/RlmD family)
LIGKMYEVSIDRIVPNGYGIGFADGLTFFVGLAAPGDRLRVRVAQMKGRSAFAEIEQILEPSADRADPNCPLYGRCGGCDFQHLSYAAQRAAKIGIIRDCLKRIGGIDVPDIGFVPSPAEYGYRSRTRWHADTRSGNVGFFKRGSHEIIDVDTCPVLAPELESALSVIRATGDRNGFWAERVEIEAAASEGRVSVYSDELLEPTPELDFQNGPDRYWYDARSFFQGNQLLIPEMIRLAVGDDSGEAALDLYCGVGLFTLPLARRFRRVVGIESGERVADFAVRNLRGAGLGNAEIHSCAVGEWLRGARDELDGVDLAVLDPPRSGTERETIAGLARIRPKRISYVACEPATLARDLRVLIDGGYALVSVTAVDLFPQTHHVETIVKLKAA